MSMARLNPALSSVVYKLFGMLTDRTGLLHILISPDQDSLGFRVQVSQDKTSWFSLTVPV